jgi:hypothetical protein
LSLQFDHSHLAPYRHAIETSQILGVQSKRGLTLPQRNLCPLRVLGQLMLANRGKEERLIHLDQFALESGL